MQVRIKTSYMPLSMPRYTSNYITKPLWSSGKTFAANAGGRGFEPHRGRKTFFKIFQFYNIFILHWLNPMPDGFWRVLV